MELKLCPFCGGEAVLFVAYDEGVFVKCTKCGARTQTRVDSDVFSKPTNATKQVIDEWNRRTNNV